LSVILFFENGDECKHTETLALRRSYNRDRGPVK
jgi:hypothetical protein